MLSLMSGNTGYRDPRRRVNLVRSLTILIILAGLVFASPVRPIAPTHAVGPPTLFIQPANRPMQTTGTTLTFNVSVANMPSFGGYDVYVRTTNAILTPTAITLATFLPAGFENAHCVNLVGTSCDANDGLGVAHEAFASFGLTAGNGTLFTITYSVGTGSGTTVAFPETVTSNNGLDFVSDSNGFNITGMPETNGLYGVLPTSTSVSCSPSSVNPGTSTMCTATVTDTSSTPITPGGPVSFNTNGAGSFTGSPCNLSGSGVSSSCQASYTPTAVGTGAHVITANYGGDAAHGTSNGQTTVTVTSVPLDPTTTHVSCSPASVLDNSATTCTAQVNDTSTVFTTPTGSVSFASDGTGSFTGSPCTLSGVGRLSSCQASYTPSVAGTGSHKITASYAGDSTHNPSQGFDTVTVQDFNIGASSPAVDVGGSALSTITVSAVGGFAGTVTLSDTSLPSGLSCGAFSPASVSGSGSAMLSCMSSITGIYSVTITGTSSSLSHPATATFSFGNFTVTSSIATADVGHPANLTITVSGQGGFARTVTLSDTPLPGGLSCGAFNPASISGTGSATLSCTSSTAGSFFVTITGSDTGSGGTLTHTAGAALTFVDFSISASTPSSTNAGSLANSTITVTPAFGFSKSVTFSHAPLPSGLTCNTFNPSSVTGSGTTILSCSSTTPGSYTVTVSGTDDVISRATTVSFSFVAPSLGSVSLSSSSVTVGTKVIISVTVTNNAATSQTLTVRAKWGAITVNQTDVTLGAGEKRTVALSWDTSNYEPGTANVTIVIPQTGSIGNAGPLTLNAASQPLLSGSSSLPLIVGGAVGAAAVVGAAVFLLRRSRKVASSESSAV